MSCPFFAFLFAIESMLSTLLRNILTLTSFGQDGPKGEGITKKTELFLNINRNNLHFVSDGPKGGAD
jgi:hypothetical protein